MGFASNILSKDVLNQEALSSKQAGKHEKGFEAETGMLENMFV